MNDLFWTPQPGDKCVCKDTGEPVIVARLVELDGDKFAWVTPDKVFVRTDKKGRQREERPSHQTPEPVDNLIPAPAAAKEAGNG